MEGYVEHQANEKELAQKVEDEHLRLQRQVRMIQSDRDEDSMGVNPQFRRQDHLMRILKKDYLNCIKDLKIARSGAHKKNDLKMKADLERALLYRIQTEQDTEEGLFMMEQVEQLLRRKKKQMIELRKSVAFNIGQLAERRHHSEFRLYSTENKLEAAMNRFNVIQGENRRIRDEIEHMLKDRALFNQAWTKMMTALGKGKKFLEDLFESSTLAYDQREEWVTKLRSVQEKGKMDQALQVQEMRDLQRALDHEMKLHNFLARKGVTRINQQVEEIEEAQKMKEEEETRKEIEAHKKILDEIFDYTKEENVTKIKELFDHVEQNYFSVYQLLIDFCAENEMLTRDIRRIRRDIEDRRDWNEMMEEKRVSKIKRIKEDLDRQKQRTEQKREQVESAKEKLRTTMEKVEEIFKMLNCSLEPYQNLLGDKGPSLNCMGLTFQLINERIQELIELVYYSERVHKRGSTKSSRLKKYIIYSDRPERLSAVTIDEMVPANPCPACMEARWFLRLGDKAEQPFDKEMAVEALTQLSRDTAYMRSDRIHLLTECRAPLSRAILAKRYT